MSGHDDLLGRADRFAQQAWVDGENYDLLVDLAAALRAHQEDVQILVRDRNRWRDRAEKAERRLDECPLHLPTHGGGS